MALQNPELSASTKSLISNKSTTVSFFSFAEKLAHRSGAILIFET